MPGELRSLAELDEVKDGEDSEDREEVNSSLLSTSTSASESLSSSGAAKEASMSGAPGVSTVSFRFRGWTQVVRGSGAREATVVHGGLFTTFCWVGGARATLGATAVSKLL